MTEKLKKTIISEYLKGKGSTTIVKELKLSKPTILKILNDAGVIRKRDRCKSLKILQENDTFYVLKKCPKCGKEIKITSKDKIIACRNYFNSLNRNCKPCSLELQVGVGNPFYGKKHSKKTKTKISKSRKGKAIGDKNSMSNPKWKKKAKNNLIKRWESGELEKTRVKMRNTMINTRKQGKLNQGISSKKEYEIIEYLKTLKYNPTHLHRVDTKICDIFIPELNLIIEYYGDYWHCNPIKYGKDYYHQVKKKTAKEIWEYDEKKVDLIKKYGYNLEVVWETELKNDNKKINHIIQKYVKSK